MDRTLSHSLAQGLKKALKPNRLNQQIFRYLSGYSPIFDGDDPQDYIKRGFESNPDVYAVVRAITQAMASVPFVVHEVKDVQKAQKYRRFKQVWRNGLYDVKSIEKAQKLKEQAFIEVDDKDDLYRLLERPNPLQAFPEWYENMKGFQLLTGNGYTHGIELTDGRIGEMWVMPSQWTRILAEASAEGLITGYAIDLYGSLHSRLEAESVMHWKYWNPDYDAPGSHLYGMSPLKAARRSIRLGNDGDEALASSFRNGGASGILTPDDQDLDTLTPEQRSQLMDEFRKMSGPDNMKSAMVFTAKMKWQQFGHAPVDLEILETGKHSLRDICNVYGFPSALLNDPDAKNQNNQKEARRQLYMDVVIPQLERDYAELNRWLVPRFERANGKKYHIDYDVSAIEALGEDTGQKVEYLAKAHWLTDNEKRVDMGYDEYEGGDVRYRPSALLPDDVGDLSQAEIESLRQEISNE